MKMGVGAKVSVALMVHVYSLLTIATQGKHSDNRWDRLFVLALIGYDACYVVALCLALILDMLYDVSAATLRVCTWVAAQRTAVLSLSYNNINKIVKYFLLSVSVRLIYTICAELKYQACVIGILKALELYYHTHVVYFLIAVFFDGLYSTCYLYHYMYNLIVLHK